MIVETSLGPLEKDLIEHRLIRESEYEGNKSVEVHYFYDNKPISIDGSLGELNLFPRQLIPGGEQGKIGL